MTAKTSVNVTQNADGGYSLYSVIGGVTVVWATVNPSQLSEAAAAQGKNQPDLPTGDDDEAEG